MSTIRDANTTVKGSPSKKQLGYIPTNRIRGNKKKVRREKKPFKIKTIHRPIPTAKAMSSTLRDANTKSKSVKGSPTKKNWNLMNLLEVGLFKGSHLKLGGESSIEPNTK